MHLQADVQFQNKHLDAMKSGRIGVKCEKHQETSRPIEKSALATANERPLASRLPLQAGNKESSDVEVVSLLSVRRA